MPPPKGGGVVEGAAEMYAGSFPVKHTCRGFLHHFHKDHPKQIRINNDFFHWSFSSVTHLSHKQTWKSPKASVAFSLKVRHDTSQGTFNGTCPDSQCLRGYCYGHSSETYTIGRTLLASGKVLGKPQPLKIPSQGTSRFDHPSSSTRGGSRPHRPSQPARSAGGKGLGPML